MLLHNLYYEYMNQITLDGNNGNSSANTQSGGNGIGSIFAMVGNFVSSAAQFIQNGVSSFVNTTVPTYLCNLSSSLVGVNLNCQSTANTNDPFPYLGYNLMDNFDNSAWPKKIMKGFGSSFEQYMTGVTSAPAKVTVFQNLNSNAIISSLSPVCGNCGMQSLQEHASVEYRAGKEITLLAGFTVEKGAEFHAYVQRYLCSNSNDPMNMRSIGVDSASNRLDYLTDDFMQIPIHVVQGPLSDSDLHPTINDSTGENSKTMNNLFGTTQQQLIDEMLKSNGARRFSVIPNPNDGQFKVVVGKYNDEEQITINIYDMRGQLIKHFGSITNGEAIEIDLSNYSKGIYLVKFTSSMGITETKRVNVQ